MTTVKKGNKGESIFKEWALSVGAPCKEISQNMGGDFIMSKKIIDVKYCPGLIKKRRINDKVYATKCWFFNFHHHGIKQTCDFFVCVADKTPKGIICFVFPNTINTAKTKIITEKQIKTSAFQGNENAHWLITGKEVPKLKIPPLLPTKKIINGYRYNTERAVKIGSFSHNKHDHFSAWEASLYKTPTACRFFLAGKGGPMTKFALIGGKGLFLMTDKEALEWAEQYLSAEEIEANFGNQIKDA